MLGFVTLVWSADRFVEGAAATARNFGVAPLIIGLTIVGFGTSAPELLVSSVASFRGAEGLSIGNAIGSNITNATCVLGIAALVAPIAVHRVIVARELPLLLLVIVLASALLIDGNLSRLDGALLLTGLAVLLGFIVWNGIRDRRAAMESPPPELDSEIPKSMSTKVAITWVVVGLLALLASAEVVVWGSQSLATMFGVPDLVVGLTIVALGTSLPELAATVISALKKEHDIAFGNIIGSNMFNTLGVLGLPGVIAPGDVEPTVLSRDYPTMIGVTVLLFLLSWKFGAKIGTLGRVSGATLVLVYVAYIGTVIVQSMVDGGA